MGSLTLAVDNSKTLGLQHHDIRFVKFYEEFIENQRSDNTRIAYRTDLRQFFQFTFGCEPEFVTIEMILSLNSTHAMAYHNHIKINAKNATVKRKINSVRGFLSALKVDYPQINENIFDNLKMDRVELDIERYGNIEWDEAFLFIEYAYLEQMDGNQMAMLLKLACITSIRLEALLSLTWENDFRTKVERGVVVHYIDKVDKGTRHQTPISEAFYNELREKLGTEGKLFPTLHKHKVGKYLKRILDYFEVDPKRNIKFHSFKKCGVNRVLQKTGDLTKAQIQGKHKSIVTTQQSYIDLKDDLTQRPSYTLDQEIDIRAEINDLSKEELLDAINKLSDSAKFELLRIIKFK